MRQASHRGITMVEVIIALVLFMGAGGGIVAAHVYSHQLSDDATNSMRAVNDLDDLMECIQATPFANLPAAFPNGVVDGVGDAYAAMVGGYTLNGEQIVVTYPSQASGRLEMLVTVSWLQQSRLRSENSSVVRTSE